jgi:hypothetical protein
MPRTRRLAEEYEYDDGISVSVATAARISGRQKQWIIRRVQDGVLDATGLSGELAWSLRISKASLDKLIKSSPKCVSCKVPIVPNEVKKFASMCRGCYMKSDYIPAAKLKGFKNSIKYHLLWFFRTGGLRMEMRGLTVVKKDGKYKFITGLESFTFDPKTDDVDELAEWMYVAYDVNVQPPQDDEKK